jgi:serine/threonine protein kinase
VGPGEAAAHDGLVAVKAFGATRRDEDGPNGAYVRGIELGMYKTFVAALGKPDGDTSAFLQAFVPMITHYDLPYEAVAEACRANPAMGWEPDKPVACAEYEYGGIDLEAVVGLPDTLPAYVAATHLRGLFAGLVSMFRADLMHNDIKMGNIVFDPASLRVRFIDLGLAGEFNRFAGLGKGACPVPSIRSFYPLDYLFLWLGTPHAAGGGDSGLAKALPIVTSFAKTFNALMTKVYTDPPSGPTQNLAFFNTVNPEDYRYFRDRYAEWHATATPAMIKSAIDVFGLGRVLLLLLTRSRRVGPWPAPRHNLWRDRMLALGTSMVSLDVQSRLSAAEALAEYDAILAEFPGVRSA